MGDKRVWKKGRVWTRKHLEKEVKLVDVRNFAKRKKAGLEDDVIVDWSPTTELGTSTYLTGYYDACDDIERWCMEQIDE